MRLVATETGRVLQLIVMDEVRPPSGVYMPDLYQRVAERYAFVGRPTDIASAIANGAKFQHGRLVMPSKTIVISEIGIYNDGVIVDALNTDDAEYVMEDVLSWTTTTFGLKERRTIIPPRFTSLVTIEFEGSIEQSIDRLMTITQSMAASFNRAYGGSVEINLLRLAFNADPLSVPNLLNTQFYIERRLQRPYSENRYQSGAPLRTEDHIGLLETIENALLAKVPA
jgi:hypothetical protein